MTATKPSRRLMAVMDDSEKKAIRIKPSKKGTFKAMASKAGKSVQAEASAVLSNKSASPAAKKKAQFAKNAAKFKKG